ncbi:hypothetical protein ACP70R_042042 [Stipagrostis hirtigluma subsp. patula]
MAANIAQQSEAAGDPLAAPTTAAANARPPAAILDPELFMVARRGDSNRLKDLLRLNDEEEQAAGTVEVEPAVGVAAATSQAAVVVQVDPRHAPAAPSPSSGAVLQLLDGATSNEGHSLLHVVAAAGDGDEFLRCARMIYHGKNGLLMARNNKGDTPLHRAAAAGNANMVSCLVALAAEAVKEEFLRMRNESGETALHQAVRAASKTSINKLMSVDSELACIPLVEGASPLYLAISLGDTKIARHLLDATHGNLSYSGPDGQKCVACSCFSPSTLPMLLDRFKDQLTDMQELTIQRDKHTGSTPLHLAVALESWPHAEILSKAFPYVWPRPKLALTLLLNANPCAAYLPDTQGLYPIHVAAKTGCLQAVKTLLEMFPDCATLRDGEERTFLHVAVEKKRYGVVQYVCGPMPQKFSLMILNAQDKNGDTVLHRAVHVGDLPVFNRLIRNRHVHLNIPNKDTLTPLDLSWCRIPPLFYYGSNPRNLIRLSLQYVGAACGRIRPDLLSEKHIEEGDTDKVSNQLANAAQVMGIVSVLVATVTFASAFTLPGGYYQSDSSNNTGAALLAGSYVFDAFIISDTMAFICSCIATFSLIFVGVPAMDISIRLRYFEISALLLRSSGRSLVVAFALGLYLVLAPVAHSTAIAVCVIISVSSLCGNFEAWQTLAVANTARARMGTRMPIAWTRGVMFYDVFGGMLLHFWSFVIIFGLPAIWN